MKTRINTFFVCFIIGLFAHIPQLLAQEELTDAQKQIFKERIKQKVEEFQSGLSNVVNVRLNYDIRKENVYNVLKLFIGEGDPYDYYEYVEDYVDGRSVVVDSIHVKSSGVKMQTSSRRRNNNQSQKLKSYIYKLYNPVTGVSRMPYSEIVIESAGAVLVDNIYKVGNHYECVAYFSQKFIGISDGRIIYQDTTTKKIRCYINSIDLPTGKRIYDAKLGDIYVVATN